MLVPAGLGKARTLWSSSPNHTDRPCCPPRASPQLHSSPSLYSNFSQSRCILCQVAWAPQPELLPQSPLLGRLRRGREDGWAPFPRDRRKHPLEKCPAFDLWLYSSLGCKLGIRQKQTIPKMSQRGKKKKIITIIKTKHFNNSLHNLTQNTPPHPCWLPAGWEETSSCWKWYHGSPSALGWVDLAPSGRPRVPGDSWSFTGMREQGGE